MLINLLGRLFTPIIDLFTFASFFFLLPWLVNRFSDQNGGNAVIVVLAYLLMCTGLLLSKQLEQNPEIQKQFRENRQKNIAQDNVSENKSKNFLKKHSSQNGCVLGLAWPFAIFVIVMTVDVSGVFEQGSSLGERFESLFSQGVFGSMLFILAFMLILLLFPLLLLIPHRSRVKYGTFKHVLLRAIGVIVVNGMILVTTAYWDWQLMDAEPMDMAIGGKVLVFILGYVVFLMFYSPPRLALLSLEPGRWSFTGYALLLAYTVGRYIF